MSNGHFEMFYERNPVLGPACVEYALIPEGMRRTLALGPTVARGGRRDATTSRITHVNFFNIRSTHLGHRSPWQIPPGPSADEIVAATLIVWNDWAHASVRYASGECSEWWKKRLDNGAPCATPPEGGEPCQGEPCAWPDRPRPAKG